MDDAVSTDAIDFARSFLWWRVNIDKVPPGTITVPPPYPVNNARVPLDCLTTVHHRSSERTRVFALGVSCKTEAVGAEDGIWPQPNADFKPVLTDDGECLGLKTYETAGREIAYHLAERGMQPERQICMADEVYESWRVDVERIPAELLTRESSAQAVLDNRTLVARTSYEEGDYHVTLEYPVKTVNANEEAGFSQPDTGPVLVPDASLAPADLMQGMQLAFIAFHHMHWAELLLREPVEVAPGVAVHHYHRSRRVEARNELLAL